MTFYENQLFFVESTCNIFCVLEGKNGYLQGDQTNFQGIKQLFILSLFVTCGVMEQRGGSWTKDFSEGMMMSREVWEQGWRGYPKWTWGAWRKKAAFFRQSDWASS